MTAPRLDSFQRALQRFKNTLPPNLVNEFSICSLHDVRGICRDIQDAHGRNGTLRHMRRLEPFIEAMEQFGKVVEMFANVNEIVCFIWGPIKFLLGISRTHMNSFDKLLDVYNKIGNAIPGLLQYQAAFEKHPPLATVLEDYYEDILLFHQEALSVFRRPKWKELFHSTWKTFDSKFGPILQSMNNRHELLESQKGSATLYEIQELRRDISKVHTEQRSRTVQEDAEKHRREVCYIREKLEAPNYGIDQEISADDRHGHSSGTWVFEDPSFCSWSNNDTPGHAVLYVNGIPGAGKTTLMSVVIEKLLDSKVSEEKKHCVAYFYFKQKQSNKMTHNSSLRALLSQLVERDYALSDHLFEKISSIEGVNLRSTKKLESLVKTALESYRISYIVLDGLDECAPDEAAKSVEWFLSLINGGLAGTSSTLRLLFCGQRDGTLDKLLSDQPSISLESSGHVEDIHQYCRSFAGRIQQKFEIPLEMEKEIILKVKDEAQGMFLYARVVLENLWNQTRRSRLKEEIEPGTFPQGIEKAYERVAMRIFERSSIPEREDAKKILGWIICARRFLRWREIQSIFCIDPVKGDVDYEERRLRVTCKELCGSLVDMHCAANKTGPEDIIKIVHETAREYLIQKKLLDISLEHAKLAIFCSRYLTSKPFSCEIKEEGIIDNALKGYYALQDYAVQFWLDHFQDCIEQIARLHPSLYLEAMSVAKIVLVSCGLPSKVKILPDTDGYEEVAMTLASLPRDGCDRNMYFNIEYRTTLIRNSIETLDQQALGLTAQKILAHLHGNPAIYKCSKPWCESFTGGFENTGDRKRHTNRHDRPFRCAFENCFAFQLGCDTRATLDQHRKDYHSGPDNEGTRFPKIIKRVNIWAAAERGDLATVSALLDSGEGINQPRRNARGETLLYLAAKYGHFELCKTLLKRGANINLAERQGGRTALHAAVAAGNLHITHLLVSHEECQPDQTDKFGRSPFCDACALGYLDIVKLLLETGKIRPDIRPESNPQCCDDGVYFSTSTPFGYACGEGHLAIVEYLLQQGQFNLIDEDILATADRQGHEDILSLLHPILAKSRNASSFSTEALALDFELANTLDTEGAVTCIEFSPDGKYLAIGCNALAFIYIVATGARLCALRDRADNSTDNYNVRSVCFSPDGKYLVTGGDENSIRVWDIATRTIRGLFLGHEAAIHSLGFSRDGQTIISGSKDGTVRLWDIKTQASLLTLNVGEDQWCSTFLDTKLMAMGLLDNRVQVWDIHKGHLIRDFASSKGHEGGVLGVAFTPGGQRLVSASLDKTIKLWDLDDLGETATTLTAAGSCMKTFKGHQDAVFNVAITPDNQLILSSSFDGEVRIWDCRTGETQFIIRGHKNIIAASVATSPTGDYFAAGFSDGKIGIWSYI